MAVLAGLSAAAGGDLGADQQPSEAVLRLQLRRAEVSQLEVEAVLRHSQALFDQGLLSLAELERAQANAERARLETELSRAALVAALPDVRVVAATKGLGRHGEPHVTLVLETLAPGRPGEARRLLLSLIHEGVIVSEPYQKLVALPEAPGKKLSLDFVLLEDVDRVSVVATSGNRREDIPVLLQRAESSRSVRISCKSFSQEGALGESVDFPLSLERSSLGASEIRLELVGLPAGFSHEWLDAEKKSRLGELRFAAGQRALGVNLRVFVPAHAQPEWIDRAIDLAVVARRADGTGAAAEQGRTALQLRPVGAPVLSLVSDNLLIEVPRGEARTVRVRVNNLGSVPARDVQFQVNVPLGIDLAVSPAHISSIGAAEAASAELRIRSNPDAISGEYSLPVRATTEARSARVESQEIAFRVVVLKPSYAVLKTALFAALLVFLLGAVTWGVRRTRP